MSISKDELRSQRSKETFDEVMDKFQKVNTLMVVRPTGFGKSYMLARLTNYHWGEEGGKSMSLYIYPLEVIKKAMIADYGPEGKGDTHIYGAIFMSYSLVGRISKQIYEIYRDNNGNSAASKKLTGEKLYGTLYLNCVAKYDGEKPERNLYELNTSKTKNTVKSFDIYNINDLRSIFDDVGMLMLDECHSAGADGFRLFWSLINYHIDSYDDTKNIFNNFSDIPNGVFLNRKQAINRKVIGVTATPDRLDGFDLKDILGGRNSISKYHLNEAIRDELFRKVKYVYTFTDKDNVAKIAFDSLKNARLKNGDAEPTKYDLSNIYDILDRSNTLVESIQNNVGEEQEVYKIVDGRPKKVHYYRFIVFYNNIDELSNYRHYMDKVFMKAFGSEYKYRDVTLMSEKGDKEEDDTSKKKYEPEKDPKIPKAYKSYYSIDELLELGVEEYTIDIIHNIKMLNMGLHVDNTTGAVLFRNTNSAVIYMQQIGRCFSIKSKLEPVVFDMVDTGKGSLFNDLINSDIKGIKTELPDMLDADNIINVDETLVLRQELRSMRKEDYSDIGKAYFMYNSLNMPLETICDELNYKSRKRTKYTVDGLIESFKEIYDLDINEGGANNG